MKCIYLNSCQLSSTATCLLNQELVCQVSTNWAYECVHSLENSVLGRIYFTFVCSLKKHLLTKAFIKTLKYNIQVKQPCV